MSKVMIDKGRISAVALDVKAFALAAIVSLAMLRADARLIDQTVVITNGWNAIYVSVAPQSSADDVFGKWPVWSVSAYNASAFLQTASTTGGATGEGVVRAPYWMWSREAPHASSLKSLAADTVLVCFSTSSVPYTTTLRGIPAAPRLAWHASGETTDTLNPVGVRVSGTVRATDWFAGCKALKDSTFYSLSGPNDASPRFRQLARGTGTAYLNDGDVVFVAGREVGDWSGPLYITPREGIGFGEEGMLDEAAIRNDGAEEKTVTLTYVDSADGAARPQLLYMESYSDESSSGWQPFNAPIVRTLATGETWKVAFALDRSKLSGAGGDIGGVIEIAETGGTRVKAWLPVSAKDSKPKSVWPAGLWCANLTLSKVSFYTADAVRTDGVAAGGTMKLKVYVHVDNEGVARLLQRVTVAGVKTEEKLVESLYGPRVDTPAGMDYASRLSSAALPVDMPAVPAESGAFGASDFPLVFKYSIPADSPSNPFRHALHPLFDNKQMDFKTPAPDGDNAMNYVGSVKPELFSIGGEVQLRFSESSATAWTPAERLSGTCKWIYTGVRRDGPVVAEGTFTIQRVSTAAGIELE